MDLADAYHSVRNDPDSVKHTTFVTHMGNFNSLIMQQGDCNASATMMKVMTDIFKDLIYKPDKGVVVYLDDIIISTKTYEDHVDLVREVLRRLKKEKFYIKKEKCQLLTKELKILGYVVTL